VAPTFFKQLGASRHRRTRTSFNRHILPCISVIHRQKLVKEGVYSFPIIYWVHSQALLRIWHERIIDVANPVDLRLSVGILWEPIKLDCLVESDKKQLRLLRIWKVIKALLYSLDNLVKEAIYYGG
jgi:hypothetical protein